MMGDVGNSARRRTLAKEPDLGDEARGHKHVVTAWRRGRG